MATRSRRAVSKSISPFMLRAVMSATLFFTPAKAASSSSVSAVTMVLSMSATSSRLRRRCTGCAIASIAASSSAARTCAMSGGCGHGRSAASPSDRIAAAPPFTTSRSRAMMAALSVARLRSAIKVRTYDIGAA